MTNTPRVASRSAFPTVDESTNERGVDRQPARRDAFEFDRGPEADKFKERARGDILVNGSAKLAA
jgi:hypothetical protein